MSDQDPAVSGWQAATEAHMATSAIGRSLQQQLDQLRDDYNAILLERDEIRQAAQRNLDRLTYARRQLAAAERERDEAVSRSLAQKAEFERLTARIARQPGVYHLTDKGLVATEERNA